MKIRWSSLHRLFLIALPTILVFVIIWRWWPYPREAVYSLYRERGRERTLAGLQGYRIKGSDHFEIFYKESDLNVVNLVLETAETVYQPVVQKLGYRPPERIPIILYSSRDEMRRAFGWGKSESAMGVYWAGTIRILSPNAWIGEQSSSDQRKVFRKLNPIAHELTHYALDYLTNGNYPRWFTEGLAQRIEYEVSGYLWIEPESTLRQPLYTLDDLLKRFDQLGNQPLAYRQSYMLVNFIAVAYGEGQLAQLVHLLGEGIEFRTAVQRATASSIEVIFNEWHHWVQENLANIEPRRS